MDWKAQHGKDVNSPQTDIQVCNRLNNGRPKIPGPNP